MNKWIPIEQRLKFFRAPALWQLIALASLLAVYSPAMAQDRTNVLLVINAKSETSARVGAHYARARAITQENTVRLQTNESDDITRETYEADIERPLGEWLMQNRAQDRILYIVLTKGIPLRIRGTSGRGGTTASVDSELTLLYRKLAGMPAPSSGRIANPYFLGSNPSGAAKPFTHADHDIYLVSRLDGFSEADAIGLIDRAAAPVRTGDFLFDASNEPFARMADAWLRSSADRLAAAGYRDRIVLESTSDALG